jgi:hypothetical protein
MPSSPAAIHHGAWCLGGVAGSGTDAAGPLGLTIPETLLAIADEVIQ